MYPGYNNKNSKTQTSKTNNILYPARVKNILLSNEDEQLFEENHGWSGLGTISFKPLNKTIDINDNNVFYAKPLFNNIKNYPTKNEIVLIIETISDEANDSYTPTSYYYIPLPLNIWNNINHNILPDYISFNLDPENTNNEFELNEKITRQLLPEIGDVIMEGRWGNSIRFSHTTPNKKNLNNIWSTEGEEQDPIIIITNNHKSISGSPWIPIQEDINIDGSSIYFTYNQEIPLELACNNLKSFNTTIAQPFTSTLDIPDY